MNSLPPELFELDSFETDSDFLEIISTLSQDALIEYTRVLERMCVLWPCSLNIKYFVLIFYSISSSPSLPIEYRLEMGKTALSIDNAILDDVKFIDFVRQISFGNHATVHLRVTLEMYKYMLVHYDSRNLSDKISNDLYSIITHVDIPEHVRCQYVFQTQSIVKIAIFSQFLLDFFNDHTLSLSTKLLVCQYILHNNDAIDPQVVDNDSITAFLHVTMLDENQFAYIRTDVADMILGVPEKYKHIIPTAVTEQAFQIILDAGGNGFSFYHNQENVHSISNDAITPILTNLQKSFGHIKRPLESDVETVKKNYSHLSSETQTKIDVALIRIKLDHQLYNNFKLQHIFQLVLSYIISNNDDEITHELWQRVMEELCDMSQKCTTGYALRLLNILSGFDESLTIRISDEERFRSIFYHKLNRLLEEYDEHDRGDILYELTVPSSRPESRKHFLQFFRKAFPIISQEMTNEFGDTLTDTDIDLYLRKAYCEYES